MITKFEAVIRIHHPTFSFLSRGIVLCPVFFGIFLNFFYLKMFNEKSAINYTRLNNEPNDYGAIYKTGTSKKYYYVPYTEEEKCVKGRRAFSSEENCTENTRLLRVDDHSRSITAAYLILTVYK